MNEGGVWGLLGSGFRGRRVKSPAISVGPRGAGNSVWVSG